jgi:hypothetical protein
MPIVGVEFGFNGAARDSILSDWTALSRSTGVP